jgi:hypothetical protein
MFNSQRTPGPGPQRVELEFRGLEPYFSPLSALVSSASEFHCRSAAVSCRAEWEEPVLGFLTAKRALPAPLPPQAVRGPDSRLMFHVPVGADLCRPPWQTEILMRNTRAGALEARTPKEAGGFGVARWSRTPCERPDSIRSAQRGPGRQQVELEFRGLKPQITCWSRPLSCSAARLATVFLVKQNRKAQFLGFLPQKSRRSILTFMSQSTRRRNARDVYGFLRVLLRCIRVESETPRTSRLSVLNAVTGSRGLISAVRYSGNLFGHSVSDLLSDCVQRRGTATSVFNVE